MKRVLRILCLVLVLAIIASGIVSAANPTPVPKKLTFLQEVQKAIAEQGGNWTAKEYAEPHPRGVLVREEGAVVDSAEVSGPTPLWYPNAIDWRNNGGNFVTPVKNQYVGEYHCGACWAFASIGALESRYMISANSPYPPGGYEDMNLSEQILVSCASAHGCDGEYLDEAARFLMEQGTWFESCYPYSGAVPPPSCEYTCSDYWQFTSARLKIASFAYYHAPDAATLMTVLAINPVVITLDTYADFDAYQSGVYEHMWGDYISPHAMEAVGYVQTPGQYGGGYFICKNSWGTGWGMSGYINIGFSQIAACSFGHNTICYVSPSYGTFMAYWRGEAYGGPNSRIQGVVLSILLDAPNGITVAQCTTGVDGMCYMNHWRYSPPTKYYLKAYRAGYTTMIQPLTPWPIPEPNNLWRGAATYSPYPQWLYAIPAG